MTASEVHCYIILMSRERISAVLELTLAGSLWGFGFVAAIWALQAMGPLSVTGFRFLIAVIVGYSIALVSRSYRASLTRDQFFLAMVPGLFISAMLVLQTWGLQYTTATKSGFITTLYVLIVPVLESLWLKRKLPRFHLLFVIAALIGVALICDLHLVFSQSADFAQSGGTLTANEARQLWNIGDFLTLLCAIGASLHILWFVLIQEKIKSAFVFNLHQSAWAGVLPLVLGLIIEGIPNFDMSTEAWIGLLSLSLGSTLIAFSLQVKAQKVIPPSLASILFLLESPFAVLFAIYFLQENLRTEHWAGAGLILLAVGLSTVFAQEIQQQSQDELP